MRGDEAGLEDSLAKGWFRKIVCVASGVLGGNPGEMGFCSTGKAFDEAGGDGDWARMVVMTVDFYASNALSATAHLGYPSLSLLSLLSRGIDDHSIRLLKRHGQKRTKRTLSQSYKSSQRGGGGGKHGNDSRREMTTTKKARIRDCRSVFGNCLSRRCGSVRIQVGMLVCSHPLGLWK